MANLEELKKRLYKEKETFGERMISPELARPKRARTFFWSETAREVSKSRWFLWALALVFILIILGFLFFIFGSPTIFKSQKVELKIEGAKEIKSGDRITWQVKITNNNSNALEGAALVFNFPDGAMPVSGAKPVGVFRERRSLGAVRPGESASENFDAFVFGGRGAIKEVSAVLEYRPSGGNAVFASDASFQFSVASAPVTVSFKMPGDLRIGQQLEIEVDYGSQAAEVVSGLSLMLTFPEGFEFVSASPAASSQNKNIWQVGDLKPSETGSIKIKGIINGANLESKVFKAALGVLNQADNSFLAYDEIMEPAILHAPFLEADILVNGQQKYTTFPGDELSFEIKLKNNLPAEIKNASLEAKIENAAGAADFSSIRVEGGSYSESSKSILWNASSHDAFKILAPDAEDRVTFSVRIKNNLPLSSESKRPSIKLSVAFKPGGEVAGFSGADVSGSSALEIKMSSKLQVVSRALYTNSVIPNSGPLPPKVGKETTYTIFWSLANMANDVENSIVKSSLPPYIDFKNVIMPADADISFNKASNEIIWKVGRIPAGIGFLRPAMQVAFQIGLTPSQNQADTAPAILNAAEISGRDTFTDQILSSSDGQISTDLPDDPNIGFSQKKVVP